MDIAQLIGTAVPVVGILLVGMMAVVPPALEVAAARPDPRPRTPAPPRPVRRRPVTRPVDLAV